MWLCDPDFLGRRPIQTFHKQMDKAFVRAEHPEELRNRHMLVRRAFQADAAQGLWEMDITADDYYKLYVNGVFVGQGPAPSYPDRQMVNRYDLGPFLRPGKNVLAMHVYYMGQLTRAWQSGDLRQGLWFALLHGGEPVLESDSRCKAFSLRAHLPSKTFGYNTQYIEDIDGARVPEGWTGLAFDDGAWPAAIENPADDHALMRQPTPPVVTYDARPLLCEQRGEAIFCDMGHEVVGTIECTARAEGGGLVEFRMGEELNEDGSVRYLTRCNCEGRAYWRLSGRARDEISFYDYMAFRYFELRAPENSIDLNTLRVRVRHYPMDWDACRFDSDSELANGMFDICKRAVMLGAQEGFLDCPSREKGQYLGDGTITAHAHLLLTGDPRLYRKMLFDFAASARICPGLMAVAPGNEMQEIADYSCQYPGQILTYYRLTGDLETVRALMGVVDALEDYFDRYCNEDGLIDHMAEKWNIVDWPQNLRDDYDFPLDQPIGPGVHNVINAFYYGLKRDADEMRALLGVGLRQEAEALRRAYNRAFRMESGLYRDSLRSLHASLHANALPLYYGMPEAGDVPAIVRHIGAKKLCCGVYMAHFVLKGLARAGAWQTFFELLFSEDEHSWANMLSEGATTCFEAWGKDQKWNTSLCHPWACAPIIALIEEVAGIRVSPDFSAQTPHVPDFIRAIDVRVPLPGGRVEAAYRSGAWQLAIDRREGSSAR